MTGKNEGFAHGVPKSWDWAQGPVISMGNNPQGNRAITSWGIIFVEDSGNPAVNTRVNIRNMQLCLLLKSSGQWITLQSTSRPTGALYVEDFAGDQNKAADIRTLSDGSISVTAGGGFAFHFYPSQRATIDPNDVGGMVVVFEARLIVDDPSKPDDRSIARFVADAGADYWPNLTGGWAGPGDFNPGIAIGKLKYVTSDWRSFAMATVSQAQMESVPPPITLSGVLP